MVIEWPLIKFDPVNLFNAPVLTAICHHTHWMILHSMHKKVCYGCGIERPIISVMPVHQR